MNRGNRRRLSKGGVGLLGLALGLLVCAAPAGAAPLTGEQVLRRALDLRAGVQDYTAEVLVTVDVPGITIPQRLATVYFKRPDKLHIESKSVVMIPRQALLMGNLGSEIAAESQVLLAGTQTQNGVPVHFLKIIPTGQRASSDRVLLWVRGDRFTVERLELHTGGQRQVAVSWEHQLVVGKYWLPRRLEARVPSRPRGESAPAAPKEGTVTVEFRQIKVNTGLRDELFTEPAPREKR